MSSGNGSTGPGRGREWLTPFEQERAFERAFDSTPAGDFLALPWAQPEGPADAAESNEAMVRGLEEAYGSEAEHEQVDEVEPAMERGLEGYGIEAEHDGIESEPPMGSEEGPWGEAESPFERWSDEDGEAQIMEAEGDDGEGESSGDDETPWPAPTPERLEPGGGSAVRARILWPALGFPALVAPREASARKAASADATRCITVLLLSDRKTLSRDDVARHLRWVPWQERSRRHIKASESTGTFRAADIAVRADTKQTPITLPTPKQRLTTHVGFGGGAGERSAIVGGLARAVLEFYAKLPADERLPYLHEVRVSEEGTSRFPDGQYHLFWNNAVEKEDVASDEMRLLLDRHAHPTRERKVEQYEKYAKELLREYEFDYQYIHLPYNAEQKRQLTMRLPRAEVLHPLFVNRALPDPLRIGHLTDTHVDVRADVYEANLLEAKISKKYPKWLPGSYNNLNRSFLANYTSAKAESDVILLTGDLIDYGRGHMGVPGRGTLGEDWAYHEDRNWFLFQSLLSGEQAYTVPTYTILGNHDWRLNPYPPFAVAGAPSRDSLIHNYWEFSKEEKEDIFRIAHGKGHDRRFSYRTTAVSEVDLLKKNPEQALSTIVKLLRATTRLDVEGSPTETRVESVLWYLLTINPFLDYLFPLPSGHQVLMLDWAEDEDVLFDIVQKGKSRPYQITEAAAASDPGPKAGECLSPSQQRLVSAFVARPGKAKIVGIHAPPIGPYPEWSDAELWEGRATFDGKRTPRGPDIVSTMPNGEKKKWNGHPILAVTPAGAFPGMETDYGTFVKQRKWFIEQLLPPAAGVRLVFSGHIHREGMYTVARMGKEKGPQIAGALAVRGVPTPPATIALEKVVGPMYVVSASAGFRSHFIPSSEQGDAYMPPGRTVVHLRRDGVIAHARFLRIPGIDKRLQWAAPPVKAPAQTPGMPARAQTRETPVMG